MGADQSPPSTPAWPVDLALSAEALRVELARVLASPEFAERAVLRDFLSFVVEKALAGRGHEIKGYTVAVEVFGRSESFDGQKDSIVRIHAGRLRRALERYYVSHGTHDPVRIEIPKGSYVPVFHKPSPVEPERRGPRPARGDVAFTTPHGPSVAVMPPINLTGEPGQEYFGIGLTEELTHELARFQGLRVVASHSTIQLQGEKLSAVELGHRLGARFLVDGGVRKEGETIKISVRLIDTTTGMQIWGDQYRRQLNPANLIALQEDIARRVVGAIGDLFGVISTQLSRESQQKPLENLTGYDALLRYHHYHTSFSPECLSAAFTALEQAVTEDPEDGLAWSLLANLHANIYALGHPEIHTTLETAMTMARRGLRLEPGNQLVHGILAYALFLQNDRDSFFHEAEVTIALNPNYSYTISMMGWFMALYGDWEHGLALLEKGMELNPLFPSWYHVAPYFDCYRQGKYKEAFQRARLFNMAQLFWDPLLRAAALGRMGRGPEARAEVDRLLAMRPDFPARGSHLVELFVKIPSLVEATLDGLRKAGLRM